MKKFLPLAVLIMFVAAGLPKPSTAMITTLKVSNYTTNCAWITPYRSGGIFGPPQWLEPGQSHTFNVDNGIKSSGAGATSGMPSVKYANVDIRAEFKGPGKTCNHATTRDLRADDTSISVFTTVRMYAELRGSPAHYHIALSRL